MYLVLKNYVRKNKKYSFCKKGDFLDFDDSEF